MIAGGGTLPDVIFQRALTLAGGAARAHVVVVPQASSLPDAGTRGAERWQALEVAEVSVLDLGDPEAAERAIRTAHLVWIGGGDQTRLMEALLPTRLPALLRKRYREEGLVIGGTSAGAAVMAEHMIRGGEEADLRAVTAQTTRTSPGLGLLPAALIDQHFVRRQRFNRLFSAVLDRPQLLGAGIDEGTALIVHGDAWEVVGDAQVLILDARAAREVRATPGQPSGGRDVRLHLLNAEQRFMPEG